jgi:hypothetical protein
MTERDRGDERKQCVTQKGLVELLHALIDQPPYTYAMAKCVHTAGGQWAVKRGEEGGREKRREKPAGQTLLGGQAGRDAHRSTQQKQEVPPVPPPAIHITQLRSREEGE